MKYTSISRGTSLKVDHLLMKVDHEAIIDVCLKYISLIVGD